MVRVNLWSGLRALVDGHDKVDIDAKTVGEVLTGLARAYPALDDIIESGVSVAVDGVIITSALETPVFPHSEIFLMQRLKGG